MALIHELDDAVGQIAALLQADADPDTNLTGWADQAWRVKKILTDDLDVPKEYPVIYVLASGSRRRLIAADSQYETRIDVEVLVENDYREPTATTNSRREMAKLCRRVEEVLRRNRLSEPYWFRSVFHEQEEPLEIALGHYKVGQKPVIAGSLMWFGFRRVLMS